MPMPCAGDPDGQVPHLGLRQRLAVLLHRLHLQRAGTRCGGLPLRHRAQQGLGLGGWGLTGAEVFFLMVVSYWVLTGSFSLFLAHFPIFSGYLLGQKRKLNEVKLCFPNVAPPVESSKHSEWLRSARIRCAAMTSKPIPL